MWSALQGAFQRKSLMKKVRARRESYNIAMSASEGMLGYIRDVGNLGENLKAMSCEVTEMDVAMGVVNRLPSTDENLLVALDAKDAEEHSLYFVKSRLLQAELCLAYQAPKLKHTVDMFLVGDGARGESRRGDLPQVKCFYCHKREQISLDCLVLKGRNKNRERAPAIQADDGCDSAEAICLVGAANDDGDIAKSWLVESAASELACLMRASFEDYQNTTVAVLGTTTLVRRPA